MRLSSQRVRDKFDKKMIMQLMAPKQAWFEVQNKVCSPETSNLNHGYSLRTPIKMEKVKNLQILLHKQVSRTYEELLRTTGEDALMLLVSWIWAYWAWVQKNKCATWGTLLAFNVTCRYLHIHFLSRSHFRLQKHSGMLTNVIVECLGLLVWNL